MPQADRQRTARRVGIRDVAERAGVSTATVSLVLRDRPGPSEASRDAVQRAAAELGYRPDRAASLLARRDSRLLGVVLDVRSSFHGELVVALDEAAAERGLDLLLSSVTPRHGERHAIETLLDSRCLGIALLGTTRKPAELARIAESCPTVVVGRLGTGRVVGVRADDLLGMQLAVGHLADLGHEGIAHVDGGSGAIATGRRRGYRDAMRTRGLAGRAIVLPGGPTETDGFIAGGRIGDLVARGTGPTAVVAFNDRCATGVREALVRNGISVPAQVSMVGYDDSPLAALATMDLTSVSQDPAALAEGVVDALLAVATGTSRVPDVVVDPRLVVRSSTTAPLRPQSRRLGGSPPASASS